MATSGNEFARELATLSKRDCIAPYEKTGMFLLFIIINKRTTKKGKKSGEGKH
jgi:hypothetical protein